MTISFATIPSNLRVPGFFAECDSSQAGTYSQNLKVMLLGQMLTGTATPNVPVLVTSPSQAQTLFGPASQLTRSYTAYYNNDATNLQVWAIPVQDLSTGVQATGSITVLGTATAAGNVYLYVAGQRLVIGVNLGDSAQTIAQNINIAINSTLTLPAIGSVNSSSVVLTALHRGEVGNNDVRLNFYGATGSEVLPTGVTISISPLQGGSGNPVITSAIAALGDDAYEYFQAPWTDPTSLTAINAEIERRWGWSVQQYGVGCFVGKVQSLSGLVSIGTATNYKRIFYTGYYDSPTPPYEWSAAYLGQVATSLSNDPTIPCTNYVLSGVLAPPRTSRFGIANRQTLLWSGIATTVVDNYGNVMVDRCVSNYQFNAAGLPDNAFLDVNTPATFASVVRQLRYPMLQKFANCKVADNDARLSGGQSVVTPRIMKTELINIYHDLALAGLVDNEDVFAKKVDVQRNATDSTRLDVIFPVEIISPLFVIAVKAQLFLQFPS
jgi:phage tail sheath gpL-like